MALESIGLGGVLTFDAGKAIPQMGQAAGAFGKLTEAASRFRDGAAKIGGALQSAGMALAPVALAFGAATKGAADFDQKLADIRAASPGLTKEALAQIEAKAKELGAATVFSAGEAADAFLGLTKAGLTAAQATDAIGGVLNAAAAEGMGLAQATDIVVKAMGAFSLEAGQAAYVGDVLAKASAASTSSMEDLGFGLKFVGGTAKNLGLELHDTAAALATVTNAGIDSSTAGTSLNQMLVHLINPSRKAREVWDMLGMKVTDAEGKFKKISEIVPELTKELARFKNPAERAQAIVKLFGDEGSRAFNAMAVSLERPGQTIVDITKELSNAAGAAKQMADTRLDSFNGSIEKLKGASETLLLGVFQPMLPILRRNVDRISEVVDTLARKFERLSPEAKQTLAVVGAGFATALAVGIPLIGALAGIGFFISSVIVPAVAGLKMVFAALLAPAILKVAAVVGLLILAWVLLRDQIAAFARGLMSTIGPALERLKTLWTTTVQTLRETWQTVVQSITAATDGFGINWQRVGRVVGQVISFLTSALVGFLTRAIGLFGTLVGWFVKVAAFVIDVLSPAISVLTSTFNQFMLALDELFTGDTLRGMARFGAAIIDTLLTPLRQLLATALKMGEALGVEAPGLRKFVEGGFASLIPEKAPDTSAMLGPKPETETIGRKLDDLKSEIRKDKEKPVNVQSKLHVDGRELALSSERHRQEIGERTGAKATPWQRRLAVTTGAVPLMRPT